MSGPFELIGREAELSVAEHWLDRLPAGPAGLVVRGEPGIGKTSVWSRAIGMARDRGALVLVARPVEAELALGYAALGDLLQPVARDVIAALPGAQGTALAAALSLAAELEPRDPVPVGRATLAAFLHLASGPGVVVAIDDVQWLDPSSARALAFAARRLGDARVGFAVSLRDGHDDPLQLAAALGEGCLEVPLSALSLGAIGHLVRTRLEAPISHRRLRKIHERAAGNPFFALELARATPESDLLPSTLREVVLRRLKAASSGSPAFELLAVLGPLPVSAFPDPAALDAAATEGVVVERGGEVRFAHPLLAAGAYELIPPARRRELHRQAAASADSIEQRARHLALAAHGPDPAVAMTLDEAARSARSRGAPETAAELVAQALRLTPPDDEASRSRRMIDQADALFLSGDETAARELVDQLLAGGARGTVRCRALAFRALTSLDPRVAVESLEAAVAEPHDDPVLAARTLSRLAWQRGAWLGDVQPAIREARAAVELAEAAGDARTLASALTTAGLILSLGDQPGAAELFERALEIPRDAPAAPGDPWPEVAFAIERGWRGDFTTAEELLAAARRRAEEEGGEGILMRLNEFGGDLAMRRGQWDDAARLLEEALAGAVDYWRARTLVLRAILRARRGDLRAAEDADEIRGSPAASTDPLMGAAADFAVGLLDYAAGRTDQAADRIARLVSGDALAGSRSTEFAVVTPEIVAVLVEAGRLQEAERLGTALAARTNQLAPWSEAAAALCLGQVAHAAGRLDEARARLDDAQARFEQIGTPWELAQTLLARGRLLRRLGQRRDAGSVLDQAIQIFDKLGAQPAANRAREELRRARPRRRSDDSLTDTERQVAVLVAQGLTNREIAAQQFTTVTTVEAHLTRIYSKLGIRSRTDLARLVSDGSLDLAADR
ncbi:MAG TPA: AAA family ATPase [Candidatus Limnocylindria bacterium]